MIKICCIEVSSAVHIISYRRLEWLALNDHPCSARRAVLLTYSSVLTLKLTEEANLDDLIAGIPRAREIAELARKYSISTPIPHDDCLPGRRNIHEPRVP